MKNIRVFAAEKYEGPEYSEVEPNIFEKGGEYFVSLVFEHEPELDEEGTPTQVAQYPLEDVLDKFFLYVSDFYKEVNAVSHVDCHLEFGGSRNNLRDLLGIVGKHVYNKPDEDNDEYIDLVIE